MGVFDSLFGKKNSEMKEKQKALPWIPLTSLDQLREIEEKSSTKPQFIFKHSTTCGISRMVLNMFKNNYDLSEDQADLYFLDLHSYREVSNETAYKFQVHHQSPQLLIIQNGVVVNHESHGAISEMDLRNYV